VKDALQRQQRALHIIPRSPAAVPPLFIPSTTIMARFLVIGAHDIRRGALAFDDAAQAACSNARDRPDNEPMQVNYIIYKFSQLIF
jgi:hypothetical protein